MTWRDELLYKWFFHNFIEKIAQLLIADHNFTITTDEPSGSTKCMSIYDRGICEIHWNCTPWEKHILVSML